MSDTAISTVNKRRATYFNPTSKNVPLFLFFTSDNQGFGLYNAAVNHSVDLGKLKRPTGVELVTAFEVKVWNKQQTGLGGLVDPNGKVKVAQATLAEAQTKLAADSALLATAQQGLDAAKNAGDATGITTAQAQVDSLTGIVTADQAAVVDAQTALAKAQGTISGEHDKVVAEVTALLAAVKAAGAPQEMWQPIADVLAKV